MEGDGVFHLDGGSAWQQLLTSGHTEDCDSGYGWDGCYIKRGAQE